VDSVHGPFIRKSPVQSIVAGAIMPVSGIPHNALRPSFFKPHNPRKSPAGGQPVPG